ncbi:MAG: AEC family transporter [Pseudomonadota bacterium]
MEILVLLLPIIAIIVTGIVFGNLKVLPDSTSDILIQFVYWIAIPALLFSIIAEESLQGLFKPGFYLVFGGGVAVLFAAVFAYVRIWQATPFRDATLLAFMSVGSNTAFVALPVLHSLFGQKAVLPTAIATVILIVLIIVTTLLLENSGDEQTSNKSIVATGFVRTLKNPLILASLLGVLYAATGLPLPSVVKQYLGILGSAVTPCALFAVGMAMRLQDVRLDAAAIFAVSAIKLIAFPALVLAAALLIGLNPVFAIAGTVCAAVPVGKTVFVLAEQYGGSPQRVAATISVSSLSSVVTLTVWLFVLARIFPGSFSG